MTLSEVYFTIRSDPTLKNITSACKNKTQLVKSNYDIKKAVRPEL